MMYYCGIDEAGFGAGAAQVYVSACVLDPQKPINESLTDSKQLTPKKRELLAEEIKQDALTWCIATASVEEIEKLNIRKATILAMKRSLEGLTVKPDMVYIDGINSPEVPFPVETVVKGDSKIPAISAASILAKVARDNRMLEYDEQYPEYGFKDHKGYLTKNHIKAIQKYGPSPIHRKTYKPIKKIIDNQKNQQLELF
ncbi:ribonuclease HII [Natranaerobius thermophilus]|uniref:Ribonuclease HII n=1 Tax=Natranaerobius thermophilus (strain ATCC BAA-1301 / DSM 18059 / JW/NM-WN-LF) TaxID=457570 RepID=RNH2_NATTJ|nr:RecName: Full=Ribonuclease HII; Short=RNase HII [Natranaerobius thermophilus JW/NM-WN-LF]ACB84958.1 RNase HII [Natranaerobius thermophilus JW/NM-WN-LF]